MCTYVHIHTYIHSKEARSNNKTRKGLATHLTRLRDVDRLGTPRIEQGDQKGPFFSQERAFLVSSKGLSRLKNRPFLYQVSLTYYGTFLSHENVFLVCSGTHLARLRDVDRLCTPRALVAACGGALVSGRARLGREHKSCMST